MASELCMKCFHVKGKYDVCPMCGYVEGTPPEQPHYLTPGTILGNHFLVGTAIGAGGFGITYRCFDSMLGVVVAVKEFYPMGLVNRAPGQTAVGLLSGDKKNQYRSQMNRFLMEAQSIAQFGTVKDIVNVYDSFEENNTAYIIMEYIDGVLLKDYMEKQGRVDVDTALNIISPIISAVRKIHAKGIVHRDISPDNIFISGGDSIKVFDFGAAILNDSTAGMAAEKVIKVGYSAPEQYRDKCKQGFFTDIYSVGAIFYQMVTGIKPIESTEREYKDELKSPAQLGVKIEPNIDRAVMEALAVKPELRFQSIQQFEEALQSKRIAEYPNQKLKKRKRRRNWIISSAAVLVLGVCVLIGLLNTVFKERNVLFESVLDEDEIVVWVDREEDRVKLENIKNNYFKPSDKMQTDSEELKKMIQDNKKIEVNIVKIEGGEGALEAELAKAKESDTMPDMFLSDRVRNLHEYPLVSLKETVYDALDRKKYLYFDTYLKCCEGMKEIPTGINGMFLYGLDYKENKKNTWSDSSIDMKDSEDQAERSVELKEVIEKNTGTETTGGERKEFTMIEDGYCTKASILSDENCFSPMGGELKMDDGMVGRLTDLAFCLRKETKGRYAEGRKADGNGVIGNSVMAGVEYRGKLYEETKKTNGNERKGKDQVADYTVGVVTHNGKMLVTYEDKFAVSARSTRNKQIACMRFLLICLLESSQTENYSAEGDTSFPILKSAFDEFFKYNPKFECFQNMVNKGEKVLLIGDGQGELARFDADLCRVADSAGTKEICINDIREYGREYSKLTNQE